MTLPLAGSQKNQHMNAMAGTMATFIINDVRAGILSRSAFHFILGKRGSCSCFYYRVAVFLRTRILLLPLYIS